MNIALRPELEQFNQGKVQSGEFADENAVIATALELLKNQDDAGLGDWTIEELREELAPALAELDRGEGIVINGDDEHNAFFEELKKRGRERLAAKTSNNPPVE